MDGQMEVDESEKEFEVEDSESSDEELIFDGGKWKTYRVGSISSQLKGPFDLWLTNNLPSKIHKKDGYAWISVTHQTRLREPSDLDGMMEAWENFLSSGKPVNYQNIKELACNYSVLTGKWLFFTSAGGKVDHLWSLVAKNIVSQVLPCFTAKVSASDEDESKHVVCIYNENFTNSDDVMMSEQAIRNMGIKCELFYKPDVYTYCGIYSHNKWNLRPNIMRSVYDLKSGKSNIEYFV